MKTREDGSNERYGHQYHGGDQIKLQHRCYEMQVRVIRTFLPPFLQFTTDRRRTQFKVFLRMDNGHESKIIQQGTDYFCVVSLGFLCIVLLVAGDFAGWRNSRFHKKKNKLKFATML